MEVVVCRWCLVFSKIRKKQSQVQVWEKIQVCGKKAKNKNKDAGIRMLRDGPLTSFFS